MYKYKACVFGLNNEFQSLAPALTSKGKTLEIQEHSNVRKVSRE